MADDEKTTDEVRNQRAATPSPTPPVAAATLPPAATPGASVVELTKMSLASAGGQVAVTAFLPSFIALLGYVFG